MEEFTGNVCATARAARMPRKWRYNKDSLVRTHARKNLRAGAGAEELHPAGVRLTSSCYH